MGDLLQLPPIVNDREIAKYFTKAYSSPYFFSANVFKNIKISFIELNKVFRQKDLNFIKMLNKIRLNKDHREVLATLNNKCFLNKKNDKVDYISLVTTNASANKINKYNLDKIDSKLKIFNGIYKGSLERGKVKFPAPEELELKIGAKVIFIKNNPPLWINGYLGTIKDIKSNSVLVEMEETGNIVSVETVVWKKKKFKFDEYTNKIENETIGSFEQLPLSLGWAITIHKSQGMSMDKVNIDLGTGAFAFGQTYVALSRCKTLEGIRLEKPISFKDVKVDSSIIEFYQKLGINV